MERQPVGNQFVIDFTDIIGVLQLIQAQVNLALLIHSSDADLANIIAGGAAFHAMRALEFVGEKSLSYGEVINIRALIGMSKRVQLNLSRRTTNSETHAAAYAIVKQLIDLIEPCEEEQPAEPDPLTAEADSAIAEALKKSKDPE